MEDDVWEEEWDEEQYDDEWDGETGVEHDDAGGTVEAMASTVLVPAERSGQEA